MRATSISNRTADVHVGTTRVAVGFLLLCATAAFLPGISRAQNPPMPFIQELNPPSTSSVPAVSFKLTITGVGFVPSSSVTPPPSVVVINGGAQSSTNCTSSTTCTVTVPLLGLFGANTSVVTVHNPFPPPNPPPPDLVSNAVFLPVSEPSSGAFANFPTETVGKGPQALAVGDFNGDGVPDLVVVNSGDNTISILLGNNDGTFKDSSGKACGLPNAKTPTPLCPTIGVGHNPQSVAVGDFNGDGFLDLAVVNKDDNNVSILLGKGDGTFTLQPKPFGTDVAPFAVVTLPSISGFSTLDLAVLNQSGTNEAGMSCGMGNGSITFLLGNGDGTFSPPGIQVCLGFAPGAMAVGDLDGDGLVDIAVTSGGVPQKGTFVPNPPTCAQGSGTVNILTGHTIATGTVPPGLTLTSFCAGRSPTGVAMGDLDGNDNKNDLDLVVTNSGAGTVSVLLNNPSTPGTFGLPVSFPSGTASPNAVIVADFDADGKPDVAVADQGNSSVSFLKGHGDGTLGPPLGQAVPFFPTLDASGQGRSPAALVALDVNGDGMLDIATADNGDRGVSILLQGLKLSITCAFGTNTDATKLPACVASPSGPASLSFGPVPVSTPLTTSTALAVTVTNNSAGSLTIDKIALVSGNAGDFAFDPSTKCFNTASPVFPFTMNAGDHCDIAVTFGPSALGVLSSAVQISVESGPFAIAQSLTVSGVGTAVAVQINPPNVAFGEQLVGTTSVKSSDITLTNLGDVDLVIDDICIAGAPLTPCSAVSVSANPGDFKVVAPSTTPDCSTIGTVPVGGSCNFSVTFMPSAIGLRSAFVQIDDHSSDAGSGRQFVPVSGQGVAPIVSLAGFNLGFGLQQVGTTSKIETETLTNTGAGNNLFPADLTITGIATTNTDFQVVAVPAAQLPPGISNCPNPGKLPAGMSCMVGITFTPGFVASPGLAGRSGNLVFTDNNNALAGSMQSVALSGTATFPVVSLSTNLVPFGGVPITTTSVPMTFTLANVGTAPLDLGSIANSNAAEFHESDNCPRSPSQLAVNTFCTITVKLTPSVVGARSATLTFTDDNFGSLLSPGLTQMQLVNLGGTGTDFTLSASPLSITISPSKTATYTITLNPIDGFNNPVSYTCAGGPPHSNCFISGVSNGSASVILSTSQGVNHGTFTLTFTATYTAVPPASGTLAHSTTASITIK